MLMPQSYICWSNNNSDTFCFVSLYNKIDGWRLTLIFVDEVDIYDSAVFSWHTGLVVNILPLFLYTRIEGSVITLFIFVNDY